LTFLFYVYYSTLYLIFNFFIFICVYVILLILIRLPLVFIRDLRSFEIRFEWAVPIRFESDEPIRKFSNRPCLLKRLKPLMALSGTVYSFASSMSDTPVLFFNVFPDWNEESVVPHTSFVSFVIIDH